MDPHRQPANQTNGPTGYTAAQLAAALDCSKVNALERLKPVPPSSKVIVSGNRTNAWFIDALPSNLRERLAGHASSNGLSIADYMESSARPWQPRTPWHQATLVSRQKAEQLRKALSKTMDRLKEGLLSKSEIWRLGVEDYKVEFGYPVHQDTLRKLAQRTIRRGRWDGDLTRAEIYLDDDSRQDPAGPAAPSAIRDEFRPLRSLIEGIIKRGEPSGSRKRQILDAAFLVFEDLGASKEAKADLLAFLARSAPFLARNEAALRRNFDRLFRRWQSMGGMLASLNDNRSGRSRAPQLTKEEWIDLIAYASKYGGGRDQGWREAITAGKLRPEVVVYYANSPRRMPRKIRKEITEYVEDAKMRLHGPRHAVLKGPYINRDPNHPENPLHSGDVDQSDDYTFVNVVWDILPDGSLWVGQPQLLLWTDERSWLPQGFVLIPDRNYNAFDIRNSWTVKCDEYGVPRKGLYLEGSFWQNAHVWTGKKGVVPWADTELGIRRLGVKIMHAVLPRGKLIERIFKKIQNRFQAEPGYVGTNPLTDKYEVAQKQIRLVKSGQEHPQEFGWLSKAEWKVRLGELLTIYANEPAEGKYLDGLTPKQAYEKYFSSELMKIPEDCRYLLACNKIEGKMIGANGLCFQFGKREFRYKDPRLGIMRMKGEKAMCWFNPERPEFCGVTDMSGENPIVVKRETTVPCHDAPAELLSQAFRENAGMERHAKEVYSSLKMVFSSDFERRRFRPVVSDGIAAETAAEFKRQEQEHDATKRERGIAARRGSEAGSRFNVQLSQNDPQLRRKALGLQMMDEAFGDAPAKATGETPPQIEI